MNEIIRNLWQNSFCTMTPQLPHRNKASSTPKTALLWDCSAMRPKLLSILILAGFMCVTGVSRMSGIYFHQAIYQPFQIFFPLEHNSLSYPQQSWTWKPPASASQVMGIYRPLPPTLSFIRNKKYNPGRPERWLSG